jgi:hypothetical protein
MGHTIYVNLYGSNSSAIDLHGNNVQLEQRSNYPWDGDIEISLKVAEPTEFELALRIPGWCRDFKLQVNGGSSSVESQRGFVRIRRQWASGDTIRLSLAMPVDRIAPHPRIRQDAGCVALQRGPIIFCIEGTDNGEQLANLVLPRACELSVEYDASLFGGIPVITGEARRIEPASWTGGLYEPQAVLDYADLPTTLRAIPYSLWANRDPGEMRIWIREG